jgi:Phage portal protein
MGIFTRNHKPAAPVESEFSPSSLTPGAASARGNTFDVSVPPEFFGLSSYASPAPAVARISRRDALSVPAVSQGRDLTAGVIGSLPLELLDANYNRSTNALLEQPESSVARVVTMTRTAEDLLFYGVAWWFIVQADYRGYPTKIVRLDPTSVSVNKDGKVFRTNAGVTGYTEEWLPDSQLIRFDSPRDALLDTAARAIRTCLQLDAAAATAAEDPLPTIYFTPAPGAAVATPEAATAFLDKWRAARKTRSAGFLNGSVELHTIDPLTAEQMQLAESRQHAVLEIARAFNIDPVDIGVPVSTHTYFNAQDRKQARLQALRPLLAAIEQRLSLADVTPRGFTVRADLSDVLRTDDTTRYAAYVTGLQVGAITPEEIRISEQRPALDAEEIPTDTETEANDA